MAIQGRGVKKIGENVLEQGRAIIVTDKDKDNYKWSEIPDGSKFIDTKTGIESVKLEGQTDWVPGGLKNDGTLCISKDSLIAKEIFTIIEPDLGNGMFSYVNRQGQVRQKPLTKEGYYTFELEEGTYMRYRNHLDVYIDDVLHRDAESGGIIELAENRFILKDKLIAKQEVSATYIRIFRIGNPYPRVFYDPKEPEASEIADIWIDTDASLEENDYLGENIETTKTLAWDRITDKPNTLAGYLVQQEVQDMIDMHRVDASMIDNLPKVQYITTYINDTNGYEIYENGRAEFWGTYKYEPGITDGTKGQSVTISLPVTLDLLFNVQLTVMSANGNNIQAFPQITSMNKNNFTFFLNFINSFSSNDAGINVMYTAKGMVHQEVVKTSSTTVATEKVANVH